MNPARFRSPVALATSLVSAVALAVLVVATGGSSAAPGPGVRSCTDHAAPCVVSLLRNGAPVASDEFQVYWLEIAESSGYDIFEVQKSDGGSGWLSDMGAEELGNTFTITFDFGDFNPRTLGGWSAPSGDNPMQQFTLDGGNYGLTVALSPVRRLNSCTYVGDTLECPEEGAPGDEVAAGLSAAVNDASWVGETEEDHQNFNGFFNLYNTNYGEAPPAASIDPDTGQVYMTFTLRNAHAYDGGEVFLGQANLRLPNRMLRTVYGIPNPETMTDASLTATINGGVGNVTIRQEPGADAMRIDVTHVTFSVRKVKVATGTIVPTQVSGVTARRTSASTASFAFAAAAPRGAQVTAYAVKCVSGSRMATARGSSSPLRLKGLGAGRTYDCRVRALSKVGPGPWSSLVMLAARP